MIEFVQRLRAANWVFVWRGTVAGLLLAIIVTLVVTVPWGYGWDSHDFRVYMRAAQRLWAEGSPYRCDPPNCFLYSPLFAAIISPLALLPEQIAFAIWRLGALGALGLALRGTGPFALAAFCIPGLWTSDIIAGNVMAYGTAAMIAVIRWPSVRTVVAYAALVAVVPKPQFLPVLVYGVWRAPSAWRGVAIAAAIGAGMLAFPGYLASLVDQVGTTAPQAMLLPLPVGLALAVLLTALGLRWPRLLGAAAYFASPYAWPYNTVLFAASLAKPDSGGAVRIDVDSEDGDVPLRDRLTPRPAIREGQYP